jgi:uncharacterized membrane protein
MEKTSVGLQENIASSLCYLGGWVTGIVFLLLESSNRTVRFHAFRSVIIFGVLNIAYFVFWFVPVFGWIINMLLGALAFILWIVLMVKAYQGQKWKVPIAGYLAEKWVSK